MQQRYYDPAIGRFLSVDPVGPLADPINHFGRYHYGLNNPYRFTDPDGRCPICITAVVGGAVGLTIGLGMEGFRQFKDGDFDVRALAVEGAKGALVGGSIGLTGGAAAGLRLGAQAALTSGVGVGVGSGAHVTGELAKGNAAPSAGESLAVGLATGAGAMAGTIAGPVSSKLTTTVVPGVKSHPVVSNSGQTFYTVNIPPETVTRPAAAEALNSAVGSVVEETVKPR
jgi:hypothetical protein